MVQVLSDAGSPQHETYGNQADWCCVVQVPSDADIIMAAVKLKRREQTAVAPAPSTYAEDVATITSSTGAL